MKPIYPTSIITKDLDRQRTFSFETFGPDKRTLGVLNHIRKELVEIESDPSDLFEWVDVIILAFDGALRQGFYPEEIIGAYHEKMEKNRNRSWPDWRTMSQDEPIEHDRSTT